MNLKNSKYALLLMLSCLWFVKVHAQNLTNDGGYIKGTSGSYLIFAGNADMKLVSTSADQTEVGNMIVNFTGSGQYHLSLDANSYLTVNGSLLLNDSLFIESNTTSRGSLKTGTSVNGSLARIEQYLEEDRWYYLSPPVIDAEISTFMDIYVKSWDEETGEWTYLYYPVFNPLNSGQGYAVWASSALPGSRTVNYNGLLNDADISKSLTYTSTNDKAGWHFIGNPFSCAVEWNSNWSQVNVSPTIYIYNGTQYLNWNYTLPAIQNTLPSGVIPSGQGFMVKANNTGASLTIPKSERLHAATAQYKSVDANDISLKLKVTGNGMYDLMVVYMNPMATGGFDNDFDAYKLYGNENAPQMYAILPGEIASVSGIPDIHEGTEIQAGFETEVAGEYTITIEDYEDGGNGWPVFILDTKENIYHDLSQSGDYVFTASPNDEAARFRIVFGNPNGINDELPGSNGINCYAYDGNLYFQSEQNLEGSVKVIDLMGREIAQFNLSGAQNTCAHMDAQPGYYLVIVSSNTMQVTKKVYLR